MRLLGFVLGAGIGATLLGLAVDVPGTVEAPQRLAELWRQLHGNESERLQEPVRVDTTATGRGPDAGNDRRPYASALVSTPVKPEHVGGAPGEPVPPPKIELEIAGRQPLWSPFRNRQAAEGFARRLGELSATQFQVERTPAGLYRVTFSYRDESERRAVITRIENRTGLALEGDEPQ